MIRIALMVMAVFASGYTVFTFVLLEPNPAHWDMTVRLLFVALCTTTAGLAVDALGVKHG